ncbi:putative PKS/NRPS-like protein biosynthetic cluster [Pleurotus pulmonarius]|nr:putative PKS/NRPS-like protein biosynthetic cluster [Pleurotus pulmonarius]
MPTPDNILDHARRTQCDVIVALPTLLQIWSHSPATLEYLKSLYLIVWSGGSPPKKVGDALVAAGVACRSLYGSTEFGAPLRWLYRDNLDDWEYMQFPQSDHFRWIPQGAGRYELHILSSEIGHINVPNLPDNGYATSDLFEKHPTKDGLWRLVARVDDVIVHATGEKTVPTPMETIIGSHPAIQGVVVFGERQVQPGVLIELRDSARYPKSDEELELLRNFLWQTIEEANSAAPAFSRIYKDMMLFVSPDRPLPRAGKGTVMRKAAITLYADDIQKLYDIIDAGVSSSTVKDPEDWSPEGLRAWLSTQALDLMPNKTFSIGGDLFEEGFDSLSATLLRHRIAAALRSNPKTPQQSLDVSQTLVYDHPSIGKLADTLSSLASEPATSIEDRASRIEAMIELNISKLEPIKPPSDDVSGGATVLLTGSTGGLGSQLLCALLKNDNVQRVFTFNRTGSTPASARQRASFQDKGLDVTLLASHKLVSYEGDLPRRYFGLEEDTYNNLRDSVTIIIHNGWRLDFNLTLPSFEPLVTGTRNLVNMARTGPRASTIRFLFTSSISSVQSWQGDGLVPEDIIPDASVAVGAGYGESKYVVERILAASGIQACSLRIGQICGGEPNGAWSFTDWVPILVKSSIALKALPDTQGIVSWIQMDCVAQVALDIAFSQRSKLPAVVNIVHPRPVAWTTLFTAIQQALKANTRGRVTLPLIPFKEWHELLQAQALDADEKTILQIPAIKLLDFFRHIANAPEDAKGLRESGGLPALSVQQALDLSPSLRGAQDVAAPSNLEMMVSALFQLLSVLPLIAFAEPSEYQTRAFAPGKWTLTQEGFVAVFDFLQALTRPAIVFDKIEHNPLMVNGHPAWASEIDLPSKSIRPLNPLSNTFCGTGSFLSNGTFVHSAGNPIEIDVGAPYAISGLQSVRLFTPCNDGSCDIIENPNRLRLATKRWYTASTRLEDGSVLIFGPKCVSSFINNASVNNPTFEFFPPKNIHGFNGLEIPSKFLEDTLIANQFPTVMSLPDGNLFVVANQQAMLFNWKTNRETRLPNLPNGVRISYPFSGGVVMLPLTIENNFTPEILTCGGAAISDALPDIEYSSQFPASTQCARMVLNKAGIASGWKVEHMPQPWTMVELVLLPDRRVLLVNGMRSGVSGFNSVFDPIGQSNADHPNFAPFIYDPTAPAGHRFSHAGVTSQIPRMYHSTATVIPDGSILIAGSNPNADFVANATFPTEYRMEFLSPPYMSQARPTFSGLPLLVDYGKTFTLNVKLPATVTGVTVALMDFGFATHTVHMDQKFVELRSTLSRDKKSIRVTAPPNPQLFSPGPGFVLVITDKGVPSIAKRLIIGKGESPPVDQGAIDNLLKNTEAPTA